MNSSKLQATSFKEIDIRKTTRACSLQLAAWS